MLIFFSLFLIISPFIYSFLLPFSQSIFVRFLAGQICFWAINAVAAFIFRFVSIPTTVPVLFVVHSLISLILLTYFRAKKEQLKWERKDTVAFVITVIAGACFFIGSLGFEGIIAVLSPSWDMSIHYLISSDITKNVQVAFPSYPFGFHVNASIFVQSILFPMGKLQDVFLPTSLFSVFTQYCLALLFGVFSYLIIKEFPSVTHKKNSRGMEMITSGLISFLLISLIVIPVLWQGFMSVLFVLLILFSLIMFERERKKNKETYPFVLGLTVFFLGISYFYLSPVFLLYFGIRFMQTKDKNYILFLCIHLFSLFDFISQKSPPTNLVSIWGWFVQFPWYMIALLGIGTCIHFFSKKKEEDRSFPPEDIFLVLFCLFSGGLLVYQGGASYSFFKSFIPLISLLGLYTCLSIQRVIQRIGEKFGDAMKLEQFFVFGLSVLFLFYVGFYQLAIGGLPGVDQLLLGRLRFFENDPQMFQLYKVVWGKRNKYDELIMFDTSLNRLRWWTTYMDEKTPIKNRIHSYYRQLQDLSFYDKWIKELPENKKVLIVDPYNILMQKCERGIIDTAISGTKQIDFFIPFPVEEYKKGCNIQ